mgnify:CR=1 FL=1
MQHLPNAKEHVNPVTHLHLERGSWLQMALGESEMGVKCLHHQGYGLIPARFRPIAWDGARIPHAFQSVTGVIELGLLFHPEQRPDDPSTQRIARAFGHLCRRATTATTKNLQKLPKEPSADESTADENTEDEESEIESTRL